MKKIMMICMVCFLALSLVGCGNNGTNQNNNNGSDDSGKKYNENTKVKTIADSYSKYTELKSKSYDLLSDNLDESNWSISLGLLGFVGVDLSLVPLTFCGLDDEAAVLGLKFLYQDVDYKSTKDTCDLTLKSKDGESWTYNVKFDEKTDSVQTKMYSNGKLQLVSEYVKLNEGYATQFYSIEEDGTSQVYKSIFDSKRMIVGMKSEVDEPESIFKNPSIATEEWTKSQELWSKYENGKTTSIFDGKEY